MIPAFQGKSRAERRAMLRYLERQNMKWPAHLVDLPIEDRPPSPPGWQDPIRALRSRTTMCQVYEAEAGTIRLSFNRTSVDESTWRWSEGFSWDDLQRLKREAGYGDREAVEVYPPDEDIVAVANFRHLWVLAEPLPFVWRK